ncbi:hypothetical protein ACHAWF_005705 [Thalassiosira exigua]
MRRRPSSPSPTSPRLLAILLLAVAAAGRGPAAAAFSPPPPRSAAARRAPPPPPSAVRSGMHGVHRDLRGRRRRRPAAEEAGKWRIYAEVDADVEQGDEVTTVAPDEADEASSIGPILSLVFPLLLVYVSNQWSRYSISYLVEFSASASSSSSSPFEAMNVDVGFTESQYGLLASTAFTVLFASMSLVAGNLADKYDRRLLTVGACAIWTAATFATASARSYEEVLAARVVMGGACAFSAPAAYALIAEKVPKEKLAFSNSLYGSGVYLGGALSSLSLLLDERVGWRGAMGAIGAFGAVGAASAGILLPSDGDRRRGLESASDAKESTREGDGLVESALRILSIPRARLLLLASVFRFCSGLMIGVWKAPYFKEAFPSDEPRFAVVNALIIGVVGASSGVLGGYAADNLGAWIREADEEEEMPSASSSSGAGGMRSVARRYFDEQSIRLLLPITGSLLAVPTFYLAVHSSGTPQAFEVAMLWLALEYLVAECWFGPTIAALQSTAGKDVTGTAQGLFVLAGALGNLAPALLGWVYGMRTAMGGDAAGELADLLSIGVCGGYVVSSALFAASVGAEGTEPGGGEGRSR